MRCCRHISGVLAVLAIPLLLAGCGDDGSENSDPIGTFQPRASLAAIGGTVRADKPRFVLRVEARPRDTNIRSATVTFPSAVMVDQEGIGTICSERELEANDCAGRERMGVARVVSPAYDGALEGPVYAVSGSGGLPRLAYVLGGPPEILLRGRIATKGVRLQAGIENVPDAALRTFELEVDGGAPGYLILNRDICRGETTADVSFTSQDGETFEQRIPVAASCGT